jgi:hypothetical protein
MIQIKGADKQLDVNPWKRVTDDDVNEWVTCMSHRMMQCHGAFPLKVNRHKFNGVCCDCVILISVI